MKDLQDLLDPKNNTIPNLNVYTGGQLLTKLLELIFYIAGFLAFFWLVWGAFQYIVASGKKDELQKARSRITYAFIGLIVVLIAFFIMQFAAEIFPPQGGKLPF